MRMIKKNCRIYFGWLLVNAYIVHGAALQTPPALKIPASKRSSITILEQFQESFGSLPSAELQAASKIPGGSTPPPTPTSHAAAILQRSERKSSSLLNLAKQSQSLPQMKEQKFPVPLPALPPSMPLFLLSTPPDPLVLAQAPPSQAPGIASSVALEISNSKSHLEKLEPGKAEKRICCAICRDNEGVCCANICQDKTICCGYRCACYCPKEEEAYCVWTPHSYSRAQCKEYMGWCCMGAVAAGITTLVLWRAGAIKQD